MPIPAVAKTHGPVGVQGLPGGVGAHVAKAHGGEDREDLEATEATHERTTDNSTGRPCFFLPLGNHEI